MINPFKLRKYAALLLAIFLPVTAFFVGINYYGFWLGLIILLVVAIVTIFLANIMLRSPFSDMLEGAGLLVLDINSTGVIRPFLCSLDNPYLKGKIGNEEVNDVYDREAVIQLSPPVKAGKAIVGKNKVTIVLNEDDFNRARMGLFQYPVLIYNSQVKSLLTKDTLSDFEKNTFAEHIVLYLNRKMEELTSIVRDFGRYVVELTKPKASVWASPWVKWVAIVLLIIIIAMFIGPVINTITSGGGVAEGAVQKAAEAVSGR